MTISNMEKNIFSDISTNSHRFLKSTLFYPRVVFFQYILRKFLNLYFANTNDLKALDVSFKILYLKNILNSLMMVCYCISLIEIGDQKLTIVGASSILATIGILFYPNIILSLGGNAFITEISLG